MVALLLTATAMIFNTSETPSEIPKVLSFATTKPLCTHLSGLDGQVVEFLPRRVCAENIGAPARDPVKRQSSVEKGVETLDGAVQPRYLIATSQRSYRVPYFSMISASC